MWPARALASAPCICGSRSSAPTEGDAAHTTETLGRLVQLIQVIPLKVAAASDKTDVDSLRQFTSSLKVEQHKDRAILSASVPLNLIKQLATPLSEAGPSGSGLDANPAANPANAAR